MATVIVFGPTGNIASVAARTAQEKGAKVILAMRDTSKTIPGLSAEQEKSGGFERVQADLTQPDTVTAAVTNSKAKHAFIYLIRGSPDHMKSALEALKAAGIEFVVFLSSSTIQGQLTDYQPADLIPFLHAQVELSLDAVFGAENYVAIRPGRFATNLLRYKQGVVEGEAKFYGEHFQQDCITPDDMGRVSGTILAAGNSADTPRKVYLYGPQLLTVPEGVRVIGKVLGKDIKLTEITAQEQLDQFAQLGLPPPVAQYMTKHVVDPNINHEFREEGRYKEGLGNIKTITGREPLGFEQWVAENKGLFSA